MKQATKLLAVTLLAVLFTASCKKEVSCEECQEEEKEKQSPIANAGFDRVFELPLDSALLDGTASKDNDGTIKSWKWNKVAGPADYIITNATADKTMVAGLKEGVYKFELGVTDNDNLTAKDTVQVTVLKETVVGNSTACGSERDAVTIQLVPWIKLPVARSSMGILIHGNKILFVAGETASGVFTKRIDIYDDGTKQWATAELSDFNWGSGGSLHVVGDKAVFEINGNKLDILNVTTNTLTTVPMKNPRAYHTTTKFNNKIFFAGGVVNSNTNSSFDNRVDIYDVPTNQWSSASLSEARAYPSPVQVGNKLYFMGGAVYAASSDVTNTVDIYDGNTNTWSTTKINKAKAFFSGIHHNGKIFMAGGSYELGGFWEAWPVCDVEIFDLNTKQSTFAHLKKEAFTQIFQRNNQLLFFPSSLTAPGPQYEFDIFDIASNKWITGKINTSHVGQFFQFNNEIYMAGEAHHPFTATDQVYKLVF